MLKSSSFRWQRWFIGIGSLLLIFLQAASATESGPTKNILVLYSFSDPSVAAEDVLKSALRARVSQPMNFEVEFLESRRFDDQHYEQGLVETLQDAVGQRPDLVIANAYPALQFALRHRSELFPGVPILFFGVAESRLTGPMWPNVTGVTEAVDVRETIDLALRLHPHTSTVAIIAGRSEFEDYWLNKEHEELARHHETLRVIDLVALSPAQILERVRQLPRNTILLFQIAPIGSIEPAVGAYDVLAAVGQRLPTYCIFPEICLDHGGIGGAADDSDDEYKMTAEQARRLLSGEPPESIPVLHARSHTILVDWRQLRHWHIPESSLPPGSVVLYREPTFWQRDKNYVIAAIVLIVVQALSIIGLLLQRARKRKAEAVLRESEERFRVMADRTPSLIWMCDTEGKVIYLNERRIEFTGLEADAGYGNTWTAYVHPDDLKNVLATIKQSLKDRQPFAKEYRLRRHDGVYRWMFDVASPRMNGDGSFAGFIGSAIDITDQKLAQEALENVSGRLIEAQENERSRIARDLHDDICQRLALLSMELEQANRNGAPPSTKKHLEQIRQHCAEITGDIQSLSHELHSSKLEYLGIVAAIRGFCKEFAKQHGVTVEFSDNHVPAPLPKDVSLCLFRIAQEALHNAVKYSGTDHFVIELHGLGNEVQLAVRDAGAGFDVEEAKRNRGLGLVSMQERVHLVHGRFSVESRPGAGTSVIAVVPIAGAPESATSADQARHATGVA